MSERWTGKRRQLVAVIAEIMRKGLDEGQIRSDVSPEVLANFLLGMLRTRARDLAEEPGAVRQHRLVVDLFLHGAGRTNENASDSEGE